MELSIERPSQVVLGAEALGGWLRTTTAPRERWVLLGPGFRLPSQRGRHRGALDRSHPLPSPGSHSSSCIWGQGGGALVKSKGGRPRRERQKVPANLGRPGVPGLGDASCNPTCNTNKPPGAGQGLPVPPRGQGLGAQREGPGLGQKMADGEPQEGSRQPGTLHRMRAEASLVAGSHSTCPVPGFEFGTQDSSPLSTLFRAGQQRQEGHIWLTGSGSQDRAFKTGGLL